MSRHHEQGGLFEAPQELPQGLVYEPNFLTHDEEDGLLAHIAPLPLREAKFREYFAKRRVAHFHDGSETPRYDDGDADSRSTGPLPPFLAGLREKVARRLDLPPADFIHVLVSEYRPGTPIGWHRDKPQYGIVVGISLAGVGRMRWRPYAHQDAQHTVTLDLAPRSMYVMRGPIRWQWQHSMPPMRELRYSITMRTRAAPGEREF
jgi:alkylated DNA repair dioxygenase AlkB